MQHLKSVDRQNLCLVPPFDAGHINFLNLATLTEKTGRVCKVLVRIYGPHPYK